MQFATKEAEELFEARLALMAARRTVAILQNANAGLAAQCQCLQSENSVLKQDLHHGRNPEEAIMKDS